MSDGIQVYEGRGIDDVPPPLEEVVVAKITPVVRVQQALNPMRTPRGYNVGFPFSTARPGQLEAIDTIMNAMRAGSYALVNGGTGVGKSPIMVGLASIFQSAWMIVGRNDLVDQWRGDFERFEKIGFMKSRDLFECSSMTGQKDDKGCAFTCRTGKSQCKGAKVGIGIYLQLTESDIMNLELAKARYHVPPALHRHPTLGIMVKGINDPIASHDEIRQVKKACHLWAESAQQCAYDENRDWALGQPYTVMTTAMALTLFSYMKDHPQIQKRQLLVVDECSELESEIIRFHECVVRTSWVFRLFLPATKLREVLAHDHAIFQRLGDAEFEEGDGPRGSRCVLTVGDFMARIRPSTVEQAVVWLDMVNLLAIAKRLRLNEDDPKSAEVLEEITTFQSQISNAKHGITMNVPFNVVVEHDDRTRDGYIVRLAPLEARGLFDQTFGAMADHCVFTSATTGPADLFRATHAMAREVEYVEIGSPFPVQNRPIYIKPAGNLARKSFDQDLPKVVAAVVGIANRSDQGGHYDHVNQKGLIHTFTNKITDAVVAAFNAAGQGHRVVRLSGGGKQRLDLIEAFKRSPKPMILVSPSAMLGLSLDDDYGRWQVVCKVPYANLGEASVAHRKDVIPDWYSWQASKDLIQAFGRIVRSPNDWGITYVVDEGFRTHFKWSAKQFPSYIRDAMQGV